MDFNMLGPVAALGLSAVGSCIGCGIAGQASHAVMSRLDEGHGKFIGMSAAPSSQSIYGFILMLLMKNKILEGSLSPVDGLGIGLFCGTAIMMSAIYQGKVAASGIQASARSPAVYGKCWAAIGIVESFALFAFVFALLLM
jgi:V/A-type H+-transporting ATPase subunit K